MADDVVTDVTDAELQQAVKDLNFEGYAIIEMKKGANGLWTIAIRKNAANGAPQEPEGHDAVEPVPVQPQDPPAPPPGGPLTLGAQGAKLVKALDRKSVV